MTLTRASTIPWASRYTSEGKDTRLCYVMRVMSYYYDFVAFAYTNLLHLSAALSASLSSTASFTQCVHNSVWFLNLVSFAYILPVDLLGLHCKCIVILQ